MSVPHSMYTYTYIVPVICIIDAQNMVKIEVFGTFILHFRDHIKCVSEQIQTHSIYKNNPCVMSYPLILFITDKIS